jgi:hypothetical protein
MYSYQLLYFVDANIPIECTKELKKIFSYCFSGHLCVQMVGDFFDQLKSRSKWIC